MLAPIPRWRPAAHGRASAAHRGNVSAGRSTRRLAEPALVLTPPADEAAASALQDHGLLTASEVAQLKLNADWVVLSACNTAAGEGNAEALSGLARAFFYAGARALLLHGPDEFAQQDIVRGLVHDHARFDDMLHFERGQARRA